MTYSTSLFSGWTVHCFTTPIEFLRHVSDYKYACLSGYYLLLDYLKHPTNLGFTWPPLRLTQIDPLMGPGAKAELVCGRSEGKAVFVISIQNQEKIIAKGFECEETAETERRLLQRVQGIPGTALLHPSCADDVLLCHVETNSHHLHWWFGFAMQPYCSVLVPSRAEPRHFAALAKTILAVAAADLVCNDISLDNLLLTESGEVIISDWGLATPPGVLIGSRGKYLFIPPSGRLADGSVDPNRVASVRSDLYALLLVRRAARLLTCPGPVLRQTKISKIVCCCRAVCLSCLECRLS